MKCRVSPGYFAVILALGGRYGARGLHLARKSQYDEEFSKMDRNGDGRLSEQEFHGQQDGRDPRRRPSAKFKTLDRDDNKSLSVKEYPEAVTCQGLDNPELRPA